MLAYWRSNNYSVCLSACLTVCLSACLPACLSSSVSVSVYVCLSVSCVCLPVCLSACLPVCLFLSVVASRSLVAVSRRRSQLPDPRHTWRDDGGAGRCTDWAGCSGILHSRWWSWPGRATHGRAGATVQPFTIQSITKQPKALTSWNDLWQVLGNKIIK